MDFDQTYKSTCIIVGMVAPVMENIFTQYCSWC